MQIDVGWDIIESTCTIQTHNQLLVRKTGEGKSLVYLVTGTILRRVTLLISSLLSIAMNQARKILKITRDSNIASFHLDEMNSQTISVHQTWITRLGNHATILIFCSSQLLIRKDRFLTFLLEGQFVNFVVVDKVHLFSKFANMFLREFTSLQRVLLGKFRQSRNHIPTFFMTETCTSDLIEDIESLVGFKLNHKHWPSPADMIHRSIALDARYTTQHLNLLKSTISKAMMPSVTRPHIDRKCIIYTPTRSRAQEISYDLGNHLDGIALHSLDIITFVGTMTIEEKVFYMNAFLKYETVSGFNPHIMCATSGVGNAGIDSHNFNSLC